MKTWNLTYGRPLAAEWALEIPVSAVLCAFMEWVVTEPEARNYGFLLTASAVYGVVSVVVRMPYHICWMAYIRYRLARASGFRLWMTAWTVAWSYWVGLLVSLAVGFPINRIPSIESLLLFVLPSYAAAILAPCLLHWCGYRIFDARVADNAAKARPAAPP